MPTTYGSIHVADGDQFEGDVNTEGKRPTAFVQVFQGGATATVHFPDEAHLRSFMVAAAEAAWKLAEANEQVPE